VIRWSLSTWPIATYAVQVESLLTYSLITNQVATALRRHVADPRAVHAACWALRGLCCAADDEGSGAGGVELRKGGEVRIGRLHELRQAGGVALLHSVIEALGGI